MTSTVAVQQTEWKPPDRALAGVSCLIFTEFVLFTIFVVAYVFYIGLCAFHVLPYPSWLNQSLYR